MSNLIENLEVRFSHMSFILSKTIFGVHSMVKYSIRDRLEILNFGNTNKGYYTKYTVNMKGADQPSMQFS